MAGRYIEIQEELNQLTNSVISNEDLATINPIMSGQSPLPEHEGKTSLQILQESAQLNSRLQIEREEGELSDTDPDYTQDYDPDEHHISACNPLNCHPIDNMEIFSNLLKTSQNPSAPEILEVLRSISALNLNDRDKLYTQYTLLTKICGGDWTFLKDTIITATLQSYNSLSSCIEGMLKIYQIQHAKTVNNNILSLGQITDELKVTAKRLTDQTKMDQTFNRDFTKQINHVTASIAQFMETLELRMLELHHPTKKAPRFPTTAPTADSVSSPQVNLPGIIEDIPCTTYKNDLMTITIDHNLNLMASVNTAAAQPLAVICSLPIRAKVICGILNKDLCAVMKAVSNSPNFSRIFHETEDKSVRSKMLKEVFGSIPFKDSQWFRDDSIE